VDEKKNNEETDSIDGVAEKDLAGGVDDDPEVRAAAESVKQAREQLRAAEARYRQIQEQNSLEVEQVCCKTVGDVFDAILTTTKRHPGPCLLAAGALGYLLGRLLRR
jgi:hypothetical protein